MHIVIGAPQRGGWSSAAISWLTSANIPTVIDNPGRVLRTGEEWLSPPAQQRLEHSQHKLLAPQGPTVPHTHGLHTCALQIWTRNGTPIAPRALGVQTQRTQLCPEPILASLTIPEL